MKKLLTIVLALALVFSVAGSAFAFTGITEKEEPTSSKFSVKVELVDYNYGWKDGIYYTVPANRAYAINEVVGALVTVVVPAKSGEAVDLKLSQTNMKILSAESNKEATDGTDLYPFDADFVATIPENTDTSSKTIKFFVTAQLKSEKGGSITAKIVDTDDADDIGTGVDGITVIGKSGLKFDVEYDSTAREYTIALATGEAGEDIVAGDALYIKVDRNYYCKSMSLAIDAVSGTYQVVTVNGKIAFKSDDDPAVYVVSGDDDYNDLKAAYEELTDEFGFDYAASGYLYKSFFTKKTGSVTVSDTAYVEPALPSSALLPDLAVTIPQTGSVSFAGFAMIALAVAAAVAVKKAR